MSPGAHSAPLPLGMSWISRVRRCMPPPQVRLHPPQSVQSCHVQSWTLLQLLAVPMQCLISLTGPLQPWCSLRGPCTLRCRFFTPAPQSWLQRDHSSQEENSHVGPPYLLGQSWMLQGSVFTKLSEGHSLPCVPPERTWRHLNSWPPPQVLEQWCHGSQSPMWHACPFPRGHASIFFKSPTQGKPPPVAGDKTLRFILRWVGEAPSHPFQSVQSANTQALSALQGCILQWSCCTIPPEQGLPPCCA